MLDWIFQSFVNDFLIVLLCIRIDLMNHQTLKKTRLLIQKYSLTKEKQITFVMEYQFVMEILVDLVMIEH